MKTKQQKRDNSTLIWKYSLLLEELSKIHILSREEFRHESVAAHSHSQSLVFVESLNFGASAKHRGRQDVGRPVHAPRPESCDGIGVSKFEKELYQLC